MRGRVDDRLLEQLVDGELDERTYREVLSTISAEPDGWRRCALAFLEDQALGRELVVQQFRCTSPVAAPVPQAAPRRQWGQLLFAIAASFLLAFIAGYEFQQWRRFSASQPEVSGGVTHRPAGTLANTSSTPERASPLNGGRNPQLNVQLVVDGIDGADQSIDVPVYSLDQVTSQLLMDDQTTLTPQVYEALQKLGSEVRRSQYWAPVDLEDGRRVVIPVEQLEITPVSQPY